MERKISSRRNIARLRNPDARKEYLEKVREDDRLTFSQLKTLANSEGSVTFGDGTTIYEGVEVMAYDLDRKPLFMIGDRVFRPREERSYGPRH